MQPQHQNRLFEVTVVAIGAAIVAGSPRVSIGETCVSNPGDGPDICVDWDEPVEPERDFDFEVDFSCPTCETHPNVALITGATWVIRSVDTNNPGDIGDIGTISCPHPDDFRVKIGPDIFNPGARDVKAIILDP